MGKHFPFDLRTDRLQYIGSLEQGHAINVWDHLCMYADCFGPVTNPMYVCT